MKYDSATVRQILTVLAKDPLDTAAWHNLLIHCFDQKDSDSFESYQIISDCLDNVVRSEKLNSLGRGHDGKILLTAEQKETLISLSVRPNEVTGLESFGRMLLQDFGYRAEAHRVFARATKIDPVNVELHRWLERCGGVVNESASTLEIQPGGAPSGLIRPQRANQDLRRMMRVTSDVRPDLVSFQRVDKSSASDSLPAPVPVAVGEVATDDDEADFLHLLDHLLGEVLRGQEEGLDEAVSQLEQKSTEAAARGTALALLAHVLHVRGNREAALELYQKAIKVVPALTGLSFLQGAIYHELGRREEAKSVYQNLIAGHPDNEQAWTNLGVLHYEMEQYEDAEICLRKALSLNPQSTKLMGHLTSVLVERGENNKAMEMVGQWAALDPQNPEVSLKRGVIHLQLGELEAAEVSLKNYLEHLPTSLAGASYLAMALARRERPHEAMALCEKHSDQRELAPLISAAWLETALSFERMEDFAHALQCLKASVEADASQGRAWTHMGLICRLNGALEESEIALAQAVRADPHETRAWSELGVTRYKVGRFGEAGEAFMMASNLDISVADWPYNAGVSFEKAGRIEEATRAYEKAVKAQTDHASARINLGMIYVQQGDSEKAASCLQGLVLVRPDYARAWFGLGLVYEGMQKWDESLRALEKAVALDTQLLEAYGHLSYVYKKLGRLDEAHAAGEKCRLKTEEGVLAPS